MHLVNLRHHSRQSVRSRGGYITDAQQLEDNFEIFARKSKRFIPYETIKPHKYVMSSMLDFRGRVQEK
jgi:hypothetical protein